MLRTRFLQDAYTSTIDCEISIIEIGDVMSDAESSYRKLVELTEVIDRNIALKQCSGKKESVVRMRREIARLFTAHKQRGCCGV